MRRKVAVEAVPLEAAGQSADDVAGFVDRNVDAVPEEPGDGKARDASVRGMRLFEPRLVRPSVAPSMP